MTWRKPLSYIFCMTIVDSLSAAYHTVDRASMVDYCSNRSWHATDSAAEMSGRVVAAKIEMHITEEVNRWIVTRLCFIWHCFSIYATLGAARNRIYRDWKEAAVRYHSYPWSRERQAVHLTIQYFESSTYGGPDISRVSFSDSLAVKIFWAALLIFLPCTRVRRCWSWWKKIQQRSMHHNRKWVSWAKHFQNQLRCRCAIDISGQHCSRDSLSEQQLL